MAAATVSSDAGRSSGAVSAIGVSGRRASYRCRSISFLRAAELRLAAAKPVDPPRDLQPHLAG